LVVVGVSAVIGTRPHAGTVDVDAVLREEPVEAGASAYLRSLLTLGLVLMPQYAAVVLLVAGSAGRPRSSRTSRTT
jgi:hypothetical protein